MAPHPNPLRLQAYRNNTPIPGPDKDPGGWSGQTMQLSGRLDGFQRVELNVTVSTVSRPLPFSSPQLSCAAPLLYPRGFPIPFSIVIESECIELLDLLSKSFTALQVTLMRNFPNIGKAWAKQPFPPDVVSQGRYWPDAAVQYPHVAERCFMGEIPVLGHLLPQFNFPIFAMEVSS